MSIQNSHQISDVKILLKKGAGGSTIVSVEKTGTSGLVDTYTVTLSDGGKYTFEVTNGSSIQSIAKTSTTGLVDTYTVTLTDGNTTTFTVTNGNGISSIAKTSSVGEVDTYTVTFTNGTTTTFTVTNGDNWIDNGIKDATDSFQTITGDRLFSCVVEMEPVQSGSGDPSPSNVRAISGHTQVQMARCGKNICEEVLAGYPDTNQNKIIGGSYTTAVFIGKAGMTVVASADLQNRDTLVYCGNTKPTIGSSFITTVSPTGNYYILPYSGYYARYIANAVTDHVQVEVGTTATAYEPYQGESYETALGQTVYGGTLDLVSGELVIDRAIIDLGTLTYYYNSTDTAFYSDVANLGAKDIGSGYGRGICECYVLNNNYATMADGQFRIANDRVFVKDLRYTSGTSLKSALNGMHMVYEIANPISVQLTPQQVTSLVGQNNLLCPLAGQSIDSVKYRYIFTYEDDLGYLIDKINELSLYETYSVDSADWTANTDPATSTDYPYIAEISSDKYNSDSHPVWQMNGAGVVPTLSERSSINNILEAVFDTNGVTLYAIAQPVVDLVLEVRGA